MNSRKTKVQINAAEIYARRKREAAAFVEQQSHVDRILSAEEIYERRRTAKHIHPNATGVVQ